MSYDETQTIEGLVELGMERSFAASLVEKVVTQIPPLKYRIRTINELSKEVYASLLDNFERVFVGSEDSDSIANELNIGRVEAGHAFVTFGNFIFTYLRGEVTLEQIKGMLKDGGLKEKRINKLVQKIEESAPIIGDKYLFKNVQDLLFEEIKELKEAQRRTNELLEEIIKVFREGSRPSDQMYR